MHDHNAPSGPAEQQTIGDFLRGGHLEPDSLRRRLAFLAGSGLLRDSALGECVESGLLPETTADLLRAALDLRQLSDPFDDVGDASVSGFYRRLRENLRAAAELVEAEWPGTGVVIDESDPDLESFATVEARLERLEDRARSAERIVAEAGYRFDPDDRLLEARPGADGGRPRRLLRDLVEALLRTHDGPLRNDRDLRTRVAGELAPFFSVDVLDEEALRSTIDNAARTIRGD